MANGPVQAALRQLCLLYAVSHIVENTNGWLGYLSLEQVRVV